MRQIRVWMLVALSALATACQTITPTSGGEDVQKLTVGVVQKEIKQGMPATDVIAALGSPNIVKTDQNGNEVWVYDRFTREQIYQTASGTLGYFAGNGGGVVSGGVNKSQVSSSTLTVIIKFDNADNVASIAYHRSKF